MNDTTKAQEVLFYARCRLEAMLAENELARQMKVRIVYLEPQFIQLAEETREAYQEDMR